MIPMEAIEPCDKLPICSSRIRSIPRTIEIDTQGGSSRVRAEDFIEYSHFKRRFFSPTLIAIHWE